MRKRRREGGEWGEEKVEIRRREREKREEGEESSSEGRTAERRGEGGVSHVNGKC